MERREQNEQKRRIKMLLNVETIRSLTDDEAAGVVGGKTTTQTTVTAPTSCTCTTDPNEGCPPTSVC